MKRFVRNKFGSQVCAICMDEIILGHGERTIRWIWDDVVGGGKVLIPAGRHSFHKSCFREFTYVKQRCEERVVN